MENTKKFDFFLDLPTWVEKQIFLLGGSGIIAPTREMPKDEIEIGIMNGLERKLFTLINLQEDKKFLLAQEIEKFQTLNDEYVQKLAEAEGIDFSVSDQDGDNDVFEEPNAKRTPWDSTEENDSESELYSLERDEIFDEFAESSPHFNKLSGLIKEWLDTNWLQVYCGSLLSFFIGQRLNHFNRFSFAKGHKICAYPESNRLNFQAFYDEVSSQYGSDAPEEEEKKKIPPFGEIFILNLRDALNEPAGQN